VKQRHRNCVFFIHEEHEGTRRKIAIMHSGKSSVALSFSIDDLSIFIDYYPSRYDWNEKWKLINGK
jgi:hypothetical protein